MARITASAMYVLELVLTVFMSPVNSTEITSSATRSAPNCLACARIWFISCGPWIPSVNPGKFATSVVVIRAPPGATPSKTNGVNWALAVHNALVYPAGPAPMITTVR